MDKTVKLTHEELALIIMVLDKRGTALMRQTSKTSETELGKIDRLMNKLVYEMVE